VEVYVFKEVVWVFTESCSVKLAKLISKGLFCAAVEGSLLDVGDGRLVEVVDIAGSCEEGVSVFGLVVAVEGLNFEKSAKSVKTGDAEETDDVLARFVVDPPRLDMDA
jgi:hypothetical protein